MNSELTLGRVLESSRKLWSKHIMERIVLAKDIAFVGIEGITPAYLWEHFKAMVFKLKSGELAAVVPDDLQSRERLARLSFVFNVYPVPFVADESEMTAVASELPHLFLHDYPE